MWKAITLSLKSKGLSIDQWELVLQDSLHSVRSLLCPETNATPHERMFLYSRRSMNGKSLPSWLLSPGPVYLKRHVRALKYDPIVDEVELIEANSQYAHVRLSDGRESTVSLRHLAPVGNERQIKPAPGGTLDNAQAPDLPPDSEAKSTPEPDVVTLPDQTTEATNLEADDSPGPLSLPGTLLPPEPTANPVKTPFVRTSSYNLRSGPK
ncbi:Pro-Pol polyprotein [Elysia marginata]|uniref:Pro-Pol polyprotein n=1 Tax=Elysia marginata TaxID=1093978 RepID=A0AAV4ENT5_9GAST|nr:Pro-Pol polyprotein [Elysia marginata]